MIASHYAEPVERRLSAAVALRGSPSGDTLRELNSGERFLMLDDSLGWAWGYSGDDRRVGYVPSDALSKDGRL